MIRLLVLEDDPEVRYGIYDYLKQDYEVFVTKRKNEVFKIFNQTNIDLIIFDYSIIGTDLKRFAVNILDFWAICREKPLFFLQFPQSLVKIQTVIDGTV